MMNEQKLYRTSDLYFSAYLCSIDYPLKTTELVLTPTGGKKVMFVFSVPESELIKSKALFFGGNGTVKARAFADNLKSLKSICFTVLMISLVSYSSLICFI
jgi:hypothetical protein